jgi:hypothetical protein
VGDIVTTIEICGIDEHSHTVHCRKLSALVDTGASQTVISAKLAESLGGMKLPYPTGIEERDIPQCLAAVHLEAPGCRMNVVAAAVDDELLSRAGAGPDGKPLDVILGHDYLQRERGALRYGTKSESTIACRVKPLAPQVPKRKRRTE